MYYFIFSLILLHYSEYTGLLKPRRAEPGVDMMSKLFYGEKKRRGRGDVEAQHTPQYGDIGFEDVSTTVYSSVYCTQYLVITASLLT